MVGEDVHVSALACRCLPLANGAAASLCAAMRLHRSTAEPHALALPCRLCCYAAKHC